MTHHDKSYYLGRNDPLHDRHHLNIGRVPENNEGNKGSESVYNGKLWTNERKNYDRLSFSKQLFAERILFFTP